MNDTDRALWAARQADRQARGPAPLSAADFGRAIKYQRSHPEENVGVMEALDRAETEEATDLQDRPPKTLHSAERREVLDQRSQGENLRKQINDLSAETGLPPEVLWSAAGRWQRGEFPTLRAAVQAEQGKVDSILDRQAAQPGEQYQRSADAALGKAGAHHPMRYAAVPGFVERYAAAKPETLNVNDRLSKSQATFRGQTARNNDGPRAIDLGQEARRYADQHQLPVELCLAAAGDVQAGKFGNLTQAVSARRAVERTGAKHKAQPHSV